MTTLTLSAVLQVALVAPAAQNYDQAYARAQETGCPLVVMVGADWCGHCQTMKQAVLPDVERKGGLTRVAFTYVNSDAQGPLAQKLMRGTSIPQLIVFRKTGSGWQRQQITGSRSASEVSSFINHAPDEAVGPFRPATHSAR